MWSVARTRTVRLPRRSRAERLQGIARHYRALAELYEEEAERLEEDFSEE